MKKITIFLIFLSYFTVFGQTADLQFVEILNNGTNYDVKIQIQGSPSFNLGSSNIKFNFNNSDLSTPTLLTAHNFTSGLYNGITVTEPKPGIASINIELFVPNSGDPVSNGSWTDVVTVRFTVLNQAGSSQLSFRDMNPPETDNPTVLYLDDETNQVTQGTFSPLNSTPLPVELTTFKVNSIEGTKAKLEWETATEVNNYGFEIERAVVNENAVQVTDNLSNEETVEVEKIWEKVAFVEGHGNSNSPKLYSFVDDKLIGGSKFIYRLKQIDIDGTFEYSEEIEVEVLPTKYELFQNYPNPFNPSTLIKFSLPEDAKLAINIYNLLGEKVTTLLNSELKAGFHEVNFNSASTGYSLASGVYIYTLESKNYTKVKKMILMK